MGVSAYAVNIDALSWCRYLFVLADPRYRVDQTEEDTAQDTAERSCWMGRLMAGD